MSYIYPAIFYSEEDGRYSVIYNKRSTTQHE